MDDREWIERCRADGPDGFRPVVDRFTGPLLTAAIAVLGNRQDAEDACQETLVQAYRHFGAYDPERSFRTWLFTILYRRCVNVLRARGRRAGLLGRAAAEGPEALSGAPPGRPDPPPLPDRFYRTLSPRERAAVALWADEDFSPGEIGRALGCSPATARVLLFHARLKIRRLLEECHETAPSR